tara:strand:+ start:457 stop:702 length:246 start_codon:yes stop_codon:yes gene_type:complete
MRFLLAFLLGLFLLAPIVNAYSQEELQKCVVSTNSNPNLEQFSVDALENFCGCALTILVDEGKTLQKAQSSINACAINSFS